MVSCRTPGWGSCRRWRGCPGSQRRSRPHWRTRIGARGPMRRVRCSPIWPPRSPAGRTASTGSGSAAVTVNMSSVLRRRRPRCGASSMRGLTPSICPVSGLPALMPGKRPGRPGRHRRPGNGCTWISMPPSRSITPTTKSRRPRPGRRRGVTTRCWRFWTAPRSLAAKRWPGCCARATPAPTPPPTTSRCCSGRWSRCRRPTDPPPTIGGGPQVLVRCDSAGATHTFADACRAVGVGFSFGYAVDARVRDAAETLNEGDSWYPAIESSGGIRDGAWVAEATSLVDMSHWPNGTRLILRKERPHPGAQLRFTDSDGLRVTAFITDTPTGVVPGQLAGLELRHRQHARVEDRIREAKATGLRNLPCHRAEANAAWLEIILAATDLVAWSKLIGFTEQPDLATCEIDTFRYRVLHVAARITRGARQIRLRIDATWRWAAAISEGWQRLRAAFP